MARLLYNPKQTQRSRIYQDQNGVELRVFRGGITISDDKAMDKTVEFLKKQYGFKEQKVKSVKEKTKKELEKENQQNSNPDNGGQ